MLKYINNPLKHHFEKKRDTDMLICPFNIQRYVEMTRIVWIANANGHPKVICLYLVLVICDVSGDLTHTGQWSVVKLSEMTIDTPNKTCEKSSTYDHMSLNNHRYEI